MLTRTESWTFNSFPVAAQGLEQAGRGGLLQLSILSQLLQQWKQSHHQGCTRVLSILSQLLPGYLATGFYDSSVTAFNSFPVAATTAAYSHHTPLHHFQFFPSCCRAVDAGPPRGRGGLSILSQLLPWALSRGCL
jgi:hypothetical protein